MEAALAGIARLMGGVSGGLLMDFWAQDVDVIAKAAVGAGLKCLKGEVKEKMWLVDQKEILKLGKTEWKDETV